MKVLNSHCNVDAFFEKLSLDLPAVLLLDYDGTLAPFVINPSQAIPYKGVAKHVGKIMSQCRTRVIIVSGRALRDLLPLLSFDPMPELWGSHGAERMEAVTQAYTCSAINKKTLEALEKAKNAIMQIIPRSQCELKPFSIAIHWRAMDEATKKQMLQTTKKTGKPFIRHHTLEWHPFEEGIELRVKGLNKGNMIKEILSQSDTKTLIAYLGDDRTDEEAFGVLKNRGLKVLVRAEYRPTLADIQITPPKELYSFFTRWYKSRAEETL